MHGGTYRIPVTDIWLGRLLCFLPKNLFKIKFDDFFKVSRTHLLQNVIREKHELSSLTGA